MRKALYAVVKSKNTNELISFLQKYEDMEILELGIEKLEDGRLVVKGYFKTK